MTGNHTQYMRSNRSTKRLNEIINKENTLLAKLFHKAEILQQLDTEIASLLPPAIADKAKVANISRNEVVIHISSAALLTRLRLQQRQVMQKINQKYTWADIQKVTIKVRPLAQAKAVTPETPRYRSEKIAENIDRAAQACHTPGLQQSLLRLAYHMRNHDK